MKNPELVKAFTAARPLIKSGDHSFICFALDDISCWDRTLVSPVCLAKQLIRTRLAGYYNCETWVAHNVPSTILNHLFNTYVGRKQMREYRLRWLDALIKEFS